MRKNVLMFVLFVLTSAGYAQVANDECSTAITLVASSTCTAISGTLRNATTSTMTPSTCSGYNDVFYKFVAPTSSATITVTPTSPTLDPVISVYSACGATNLKCENFTGSGTAEETVLPTLGVGNTYYIKVSSYYSASPNPTFTICVLSTGPNPTLVVNDECSGAERLATSTTACIQTLGTLVNATTSTITTSTCSGYNDVFYKFIPTTTSSNIFVSPSSTFDPVISVFSSCGSTSIVCVNDNSVGYTEQALLPSLTVGNMYYIKVSSSSSTPVNPTFKICVIDRLVPPPPVNDECRSATTLTQSATCAPTFGNMTGARTSSITSSCGTYDDDVFYKFVAKTTSAIVTVTPSSTFNPTLGVFSSCGTTAISCVDAAGNGIPEISTLTSLTVDSTYYIKISGYSSTSTSSDFTICVVNGLPGIVNDECTSAITLTPSNTCTPMAGTLANATTSHQSTGCNGWNDVFYKFVATSSSTSVILTSSATFNAILSIYDACGNPAIACQDNGDAGVTETALLTSLTIGATYYIKVASMSTPPLSPTFTICVVNFSPPANDECTSATTLTASSNCTSIAGTLEYATTSTITTGCDGYNDVFYKFIATSTKANVTVTPSATFDPKLSVFSSCGATSISCVDAHAEGVAEISTLTSLTIGTTYYIKVSNYSLSSTTPTFNICVVNVPVETIANDECASATTLTASSTCTSIAGTLAGATTSAITTGCGGYNDVFYKFVATSANATVTVTPSTTFDPKLSIFSSCGTTEISCVDAHGNGVAEISTLTSLAIGAIYYVKVSSFSSLSSTPTFNICVVGDPVATPANDECSSATTLIASSTCTPIAGTLAGATTSSVTTECGGFNDVFYKFVATSTSASVTVIPSVSLNAKLSVFTGCGTTNIVCQDVVAEGGTETASLNSLTIGTTYYIKVSSYSSLLSTSTFNICVVSVPIVASTSDECETATTLVYEAAPINGTTVNASASGQAACKGNADDDVWYKFTPTVTGSTLITLTGASNFDAVLQVSSNCGTTLTQLACTDVTGNGGVEQTILSTTAGVTYYVRIYSYASGTAAMSTFSVGVSNIPSLVNDNCETATALVYEAAPINGTTLNATASGQTTCSRIAADDDVWYKFTPSVTGNTLITVTGDSNFDAVMQITSDCGPTLTQLACVDINAKGGIERSIIYTTAEITYYVRVYSYASGVEAMSTFSIAVNNSIPLVNDNCETATALAYAAAPITGTTINATASGQATCTGTADDDVWYKFTPTVTGNTIITVTGATDFKAVMQISSTCGTTLTELACLAATANGRSVKTIFSTVAGVTYYARIYSANDGVPYMSTFSIEVNNSIPPVNDNCTNATALTYGEATTNGTTVGATASGQTACSQTAADDDVWYKFTPSVTGNTLITLTGDSNFDAVLQITSDCGTTLTELACMDVNGDGGMERSIIPTIAGATYYARIYSYASGAIYMSTFSIAVNNSIPPANDNCTNATALTYGAVAINGTTFSATASGQTACAGTADDDVWYKFTPTVTGNSIINVTAATDFKAVLQISSTCGTTLTELACVAATANGRSAKTVFSTVAGETYYARVYSADDGVPYMSTFSIEVNNSVHPANDNCTGAATLGYGANPIQGSTINATASGQATCISTTNAADDDVWYKFTPSVTGSTVVNVSGAADFDAVVQISSNCGTTLTGIACVDDGADGDSENTSFPTIAGVTYYARIYSWGNGFSKTSTFTIGVNSSIAVVNDNCSAAIPLTFAAAPLAGTTVNALPSGQPVCNGIADDDVWYSYTPTVSDNVAISVVGAGGFDPVVQISSTCGVALASVVCVNQTGIGGTEMAQFYAVAGTTYYARVYDVNQAVYGSFTIAVNTCSTPSPIVTSSINYCVGDVAQPLSATGNNLNWYNLQNGGIPSTSIPTPVTTISGVFNYYVSQTIGSCESGRSLITVEVHSSPKPIVTNNVTYCLGSVAQQLSASGNNLKWYNSPNTGVATTIAPIPEISTSGVLLYYVSQTIGTCESERVAVIVNVNPNSTAPNVLAPVDYCLGSASVPLVAYGSNLKWYTTQNATSFTTLPITPSTSTIGTTNYYVSQTYNGCESSRSNITVNVRTAPAAPNSVSPVNYCLGSTSNPLVASGSNLYWYGSGGNCSGTAASPIPSTSIAGSTSYFVSQTIGGCESAKKEVVVIVSAGGAAPAVVSPVNLFVGASASALTASGTNLKWYTSATGGSGSTVAPIPSTAVSSMTDYYVSQTVNGCESARSLIKVIVNGEVSGPTCFVLGGTYPFEVSPINTVNATNYNWWVNGSVQSIAASNSPKATISVGQYYTSGQVCVGINYSQAPWYKQICTTVDACSNASSRMGNVSSTSLVNVSPNPSFDQFSIKAFSNVQQVTIKNMLGQEVYVIGDMVAEQTINFGLELALGMYIVQYKTSDGSNHTVSIIKQ